MKNIKIPPIKICNDSWGIQIPLEYAKVLRQMAKQYLRSLPAGYDEELIMADRIKCAAELSERMD